MTTFTNSNLKTIRADIADALNAVNKKHGITLNLGNIRYSDSEFSGKLTGSGATNSTDVARLKFEKYAISFGIKAKAFGEIFTSRGDTFKIVGIKERSYKYPVLAKNVANGKTYKLPVDMLSSELMTY